MVTERGSLLFKFNLRESGQDGTPTPGPRDVLRWGDGTGVLGTLDTLQGRRRVSESVHSTDTSGGSGTTDVVEVGERTGGWDPGTNLCPGTSPRGV